MTSGVQSGWEAIGRLQGLAGTRMLQGQGDTEEEICRNVITDGERARAKRQGERMILGICILGASDSQAPSFGAPSCLALAVWHKLLGMNVYPSVCASVDMSSAAILKEHYQDQKQWRECAF